MTPEKQRIAIAEACGTHRIERTARSWNPSVMPEEPVLVLIDRKGLTCTYWNNASSGDADFEPPLRYDEDLNAMHEAEKALTNSDDDIGSRWRFVEELIDITRAESMEVHREVFAVVNATAAQRAEAFLRTIGKWEQ